MPWANEHHHHNNCYNNNNNKKEIMKREKGSKTNHYKGKVTLGPPNIPDASCSKYEQSNFMGKAPGSPPCLLLCGMWRPGKTLCLLFLIFNQSKEMVITNGTNNALNLTLGMPLS
jgi:hypothetical protein